MRFKSIIIFFSFWLSLLSYTMTAQQVLYTPVNYIYPTDSETPPVLGNQDPEFWLVFSDRSDNLMYSDEACTVKTSSPVKFMQPFFIFKESSDQTAVQVVECSYVNEKGSLKNNFLPHSGWMKKSDLVLSRRCLSTNSTELPGTENVVFYKRAILANKYTGKPTGDFEQALYYSDPECTRIIDTATTFHFNYVFKETADACLMAEDHLINPYDSMQIKGWVKKEQIMPWNHNLCLEVNWDKAAITERTKAGITAKIFAKPEDAENFYLQNLTSGLGQIPVNEGDTEGVRLSGDVFRYPVLNFHDDNLIEIGVIDNLLVTPNTQIPLNSDPNGPSYMDAYTVRQAKFMQYPLFLNVMLLDLDDLYSIIYVTEQLIPTRDFCKSSDEFRMNIQEAWHSILIEQLNYFPPDPEIINKMTLNELSTLLTGWRGREVYKEVRLEDVTDPSKFTDETLYLYLIDWMITKGYLQSILERRNIFNQEFFKDHVSCYVIEYLIVYLNARSADPAIILDDPNLENEIIDKLSSSFADPNLNFWDTPLFKVADKVPENPGTTYYWIDTRVFPHIKQYSSQKDLYKDILDEFNDRY